MPTLKQLADFMLGRPVPDEFFAPWLEQPERERLAYLQHLLDKYASEAAELLVLRALGDLERDCVDRHRSALADLTAMAIVWRGEIIARAIQRLHTAPVVKAPVGRPKKYNFDDLTPFLTKKRAVGRPKLIPDDSMLSVLRGFLEGKAVEERKLGRKITDLAYCQITAERLAIPPYQRKKVAASIARDISKARQKFGKPLRVRMNPKTQR